MQGRAGNQASVQIMVPGLHQALGVHIMLRLIIQQR